MMACCSFAGLWPITPCLDGVCTPNMPAVHHHHGWNQWGELITSHGGVPDDDWTPEHAIATPGMRTQESGVLV
jgi:hypothetical protein